MEHCTNLVHSGIMVFQHHSQLLEHLITAVIVINRDYQVIYANHAALDKLSTGRKQLYRMPITDAFAFCSLDCDVVINAFNTHESFSQNDVEICLNDESILHFDISITYLEMHDCPALMIEAKHIDQQKRISQENMQHSQQQAAKQLVRGLAHEIKNPLGGIRGAAQLLAMELEDAEQAEYTNMIIEQSDRLRNLVDRLLGPNALPSFSLANIHQPLESVYQLVKNDNPYNINIIRDYDPSIPDMLIDTDMLQQAILNIVRNGMQALVESQSKIPKLRIKTRVERNHIIQGEKVPLCAKISIYDNGPGIAKHIKDTLFYPMVTSKADGTGLGLSIAQTLIEHHHGKIDLESRKGLTEFIIYLPIAQGNRHE